VARGAGLARMTALRLIEASVRRDGRAVLDKIDFELSPGEMVGVVGANGAGKTTLIRAALGLARLSSGEASLFGDNVARLSDPERARRAAYLPQERHIGWNMSAWRIASLGAADRTPAAARDAAHAALSRVGLKRLSDRGVLEMSGGERARVLLTRLLAAEAPLLVADEPIAGLDPDAQLMALDLLAEEAANGRAVLLTLHDLSLASRYCARLLVLSEGRVLADRPPDEALAEPILREAFGLDGRLERTEGGMVLAARRAKTSVGDTP
jgi:iron complex transport system ATP-binding protein